MFMDIGNIKDPPKVSGLKALFLFSFVLKIIKRKKEFIL